VFILTCCFKSYNRKQILEVYGLNIQTSNIVDLTDNDRSRSQEWRRLGYETLISTNSEINERISIGKFSSRFRIVLG
jgi:hypothetical protein